MRHHPIAMLVLFGALVVASPVAGVARAADRNAADITFSTGYAHGSFRTDAATELKEQDGMRLELRLTAAPLKHLVPVRVGLGISTSGFLQAEHPDQIFDNWFHIDSDNFEAMSVWTVEAQVSWRQFIGADDRFCIEPGIGVGAAAANYWSGVNLDDPHIAERQSVSDTSFSYRPFLRVGYNFEHFVMGAEASYLISDFDFGGGLRGDFDEIYAGIFIGVTF